MNRNTLRFLIMLGALVPLLGVAHAVSQKSNELVANIPFKFTVCKEEMPAGKYKVFPISSANPRLLLVRGDDNQSAEIVCTHDVKASKPASGGKLIFNRYGDQYFLSELWFAGDITGNVMVKSEKEEAILKTLPPRKKREKVTVTVTEVKPD